MIWNIFEVKVIWWYQEGRGGGCFFIALMLATTIRNKEKFNFIIMCNIVFSFCFKALVLAPHTTVVVLE